MAYIRMHACMRVCIYVCLYVCMCIYRKISKFQFSFFQSNFNERGMVPKVRTMCRKLCVNTFLLLFVLFSSGHVPPLCHGHGCAFAVQYGDQAAAFHSSFCPGGGGCHGDPSLKCLECQDIVSLLGNTWVRPLRRWLKPEF